VWQSFEKVGAETAEKACLEIKKLDVKLRPNRRTLLHRGQSELCVTKAKCSTRAALSCYFHSIVLGTIENHGNTEITETVIFVKGRDFAKMP